MRAPSSIIDGAARFLAELPEEIQKKGGERRHRGKLEFGDSFLAFDLYKGTGRNIEAIGDQANACYEFGQYDGCAVLCRRLLEMLLILAFKHHNVEARIKGGDGHYLQISGIVGIARGDADLDLSRKTKEYLGTIVERGNLSAHMPLYNALKRDLDDIAFPFRVLVEELMHKSGKR